MIKIKKENKEIYNIFEKYFLQTNNDWDNNIKIKYAANKININVGTIKRWILLKEIPWQYFNDINNICGNKFELIQSEREKNKQLDQFYTNEEEAKKLIKQSLSFIQENYQINLNEYTLIEPSAGNGAFFKNFPKKIDKLGLDIDPKRANIIKKNFFEFNPKKEKNIVIGNPPFGLRGNLALRFINKAAEFSDFICFVLPPLFNSNGKGSPMLRINKDFMLVKEVKVSNNSFTYPNGDLVSVNSIFQIWTKIYSPKVKPLAPPKKVSEWIKIYSLSNGKTPSSKRNIKMIGKCDYYLPSTTFKNVSLTKNFVELPHNRGYGIVVLKNNKKINNIIEKIYWENIAFSSTNNAKNLRSNLIIEAIESMI